MPLPQPETRDEITPRNTPLHRRKRGRNLAILAMLVALMGILYIVTIVRIQAGLGAQ